ncbi:MAG: hypothetical protein HUJ76_06650 [Parasporobacterium sp.]|nr:hypothetical protein [Parasporobacterium sp.]
MGVKLERIVKTYYDNLEQGKITARKCKDCGAIEWPPLLACNTCGSTEMEWIEIEAKGKMLQFVMSSPITRRPEMEDIKPYVLAVVQIDEGPAVNAMVRGITRKNKKLIESKLPYPVHATIVPRDGYSTVIFDIDEVEE